jgi:hypothetical protein
MKKLPRRQIITELRLAIFCRQYLRARDTEDEPAMRIEAGGLCHFLGSLLSQRLANDSRWNSQERWIDDMIGASIVVEGSTFTIRGAVVWGLRKDAGGPQWHEPFEGQLLLTPDNGAVEDYTLRFGNREKPPVRVIGGLYETLADPAGRIVVEVTPGLDSPTEADRKLDLCVREWSFEFRRHEV